MKIGYTLFTIIVLNTAYSQCGDEEFSTIGILDDISEEIYNDDESVNAYSIYSWTSDDTSRILSGNGIQITRWAHFPT